MSENIQLKADLEDTDFGENITILAGPEASAPVATVFNFQHSPCAVNEDEWEAADKEARALAILFEAAPALLSACKGALIELEAAHQVLLLDPRNKNMAEATIIGILRAAIAKASPTPGVREEQG